jgi:hypothetical protein
MPRARGCGKGGHAVKMTARTSSDLQRAAEIISTLPEGRYEIEVVKRRVKRSGQQNRLLWAIYTAIADATGHTPEEVHEACKAKFLPPEVLRIGEEEVVVSGSTAKRDVAEFSDYVERVQSWAQNDLGVMA